jgi:hypothetical protein
MLKDRCPLFIQIIFRRIFRGDIFWGRIFHGWNFFGKFNYFSRRFNYFWEKFNILRFPKWLTHFAKLLLIIQHKPPWSHFLINLRSTFNCKIRSPSPFWPKWAFPRRIYFWLAVNHETDHFRVKLGRQWMIARTDIYKRIVGVEIEIGQNE